MPEYQKRCPSCFSADHVKYRLRLPFTSGDIYFDLPEGYKVRHCTECGLKFHADSAVELREVRTTEAQVMEALRLV